MSLPGTPSNFQVQTGNQQILVSWSLLAGATNYQISRSLDNVTFTVVSTISGSPLATSYLDTTVSVGIQYWYYVAASSDGVNYAVPTISQSSIPSQSGEMSLSQIRLQAKQRADRVNSQFVTDPEWNTYINQAMFELYDLLVTVYEDYFIATPVKFTADGNTFLYPMPNGLVTFTNGVDGTTQFIAPPYYKLIGVDLALNTAVNAWVTINKFNFIDRNNFVFPNTASTIYGVFNLQYRLMGNYIEFVPTPSAGQSIRIWYIPRLTQLLKDTDTTSQGISGWIEYVIVRAAKYALDKEETDTTILTQELVFLKGRVEESASNRDAGQPDKISDINRGSYSNGWRGGNNGPIGGY